MFKKTFSLISIMAIFMLFFFMGMKFQEKYKSQNEDITNNFSISYKNETNKIVNVRYKYMLNYVTTKDYMYELAANKDSLYVLNDEYNRIVAEMDTYSKVAPIIPQVSNSMILLPGESINKHFIMKFNPKLYKYHDKVRTETQVIIEQLEGKQWQPVRQAFLVERGPYWSLNKGPVKRMVEQAE